MKSNCNFPTNRSHTISYIVTAFLAWALVTSCSDPLSPATRGNNTAVLCFYLSAENAAAAQLASDLDEIRSVPDMGEDIAVYVLYDIAGRPPGLIEKRRTRTLDRSRDLSGLSPAAVDMADEAILADFLKLCVRENPESEILLFLGGESGAVYRGLLYDAGTADYLTSAELSRALKSAGTGNGERAVDAVVFDTSFSGGLEICYELYSELGGMGDSLPRMPHMLVSSGWFPGPGREYAGVLEAVKELGRDHTNPENILDCLQQRFISRYGSASEKPGYSSLRIPDSFPSAFFPILHILFDYMLNLDWNSPEADSFRQNCLHAETNFYRLPGPMYLDVSALLRELEANFSSPELMGIVSEMRAVIDSTRMAAGSGSRSAAGGGTLFLCNLLDNGSPDPELPNNYNPLDGAPSGIQGFLQDYPWAGNPQPGNGILGEFWNSDY